MSKSRPDGQFSGTIHLSNQDLENVRADKLIIRAVLPPGDERLFVGEVRLTANNGLTVISDIDDTIKITNVNDRKATLRNTFLEPFRAVPGMAEAYRNWAQEEGAEFCYVSASPWQLLLPLSSFLSSNGFPAGAFYLKNFRWKDESFFNLFESPEKYKPRVIEPLLKEFPHRRFVLAGDSGERDPEIYGELARRFPAQVVKILIRDVTNEPEQSERYQGAGGTGAARSGAFHGLAPGVWTVFRDPKEIVDCVSERK